MVQKKRPTKATKRKEGKIWLFSTMMTGKKDSPASNRRKAVCYVGALRGEIGANGARRERNTKLSKPIMERACGSRSKSRHAA